MLKYHIKLAWRNLAKNRFYTIINILGLVCGIAFVLVIATYIWQAYQVNGHLRNLGNQYLIQSEYREPGMGLSLTTPGALPQALKEAYPHLVADYSVSTASVALSPMAIRSSRKTAPSVIRRYWPCMVLI